MLKQVVVYTGQSYMDIAIQEYGSLESVFEVLKDNELSLDSLLQAGTELDAYSEKIAQPGILEFMADYSDSTEHPNTGDLPEGLKPSGIDYMGIEFDFIVS